MGRGQTVHFSFTHEFTESRFLCLLLQADLLANSVLVCCYGLWLKLAFSIRSKLSIALGQELEFVISSHSFGKQAANRSSCFVLSASVSMGCCSSLSQSNILNKERGEVPAFNGKRKEERNYYFENQEQREHFLYLLILLPSGQAPRSGFIGDFPLK